MRRRLENALEFRSSPSSCSCCFGRALAPPRIRREDFHTLLIAAVASPLTKAVMAVPFVPSSMLFLLEVLSNPPPHCEGETDTSNDPTEDGADDAVAFERGDGMLDVRYRYVVGTEWLRYHVLSVLSGGREMEFWRGGVVVGCEVEVCENTGS